MKQKNSTLVKSMTDKIQESSETDTKKSDSFSKLIIFHLDNEEFAIPIEDLKEIIRLTELTPLPNSPDYIMGILNLRGHITVVIDLHKLLKTPKTSDSSFKHVLISEIENSSYGILVDQVSEILNVKSAKIKKSPELLSSKFKNQEIKGVLVLDNPKKKSDKQRLIIILNLPKILEIDELSSVNKNIKNKSK
ncbi:hypothetical protein GF354_01060 [Candidatus Peregrinibacteria bacterium]|nr:hypothetical protein [Candidatus Peregrinibacteria bacterium]